MAQAPGDPIRLTAYRLVPNPPPLVPAPSQREWMEASTNRFAYRCLPLVIANMHGWQILCPAGFSAEWDGRGDPAGVHIEFHSTFSPHIATHFGGGVLTLMPGYLFRTSPGYNLWVKGATNDGKPALEALEGIVETDWAVTPFTMNWRFQRPGVRIHFRRQEPMCTVFPIPRGLLEAVEPELMDLQDDPELAAAYEAWREGRSGFLRDLRAPEETPAKSAKWQKDYFRGTKSEGGRFPDHQTRLNLKPFAEVGRASQEPAPALAQPAGAEPSPEATGPAEETDTSGITKS